MACKSAKTWNWLKIPDMYISRYVYIIIYTVSYVYILYISHKSQRFEEHRLSRLVRISWGPRNWRPPFMHLGGGESCGEAWSLQVYQIEMLIPVIWFRRDMI